MRTRPPRPIVGTADDIRRIAAQRVPGQDNSAIDALVKKLSARPERNGRTQRPKGARPEA
jgi:hypothetical protein